MRNFLFFLAMWVSAANVAAQDCPALPSDIKPTTLVGKNLWVQGHGVTVVQVRAQAQAADEIASTAKAWRAAGDQVTTTHAGGWQIVSALTRTCMATLQLPAKGTDGYFSVSTAGMAPPAPTALPLALPDGVAVTSTVISNDDGRKGYTLTVTSDLTPDSFERVMADALRNQGWEAISGFAVTHPQNKHVGRVLSAQRGRLRVEVAALSGMPTRAVINVSDAL